MFLLADQKIRNFPRSFTFIPLNVKCFLIEDMKNVERVPYALAVHDKKEEEAVLVF